jgi:hypothetical protein
LGEIESNHVPSVDPVGHPETHAPLARAESGETVATVHVGGETAATVNVGGGQAVGAKRRVATWAALGALFVLGASSALMVRIVRGSARASSAPEVVAPSAPPMADAPAAASHKDPDATNPPALVGTAARPAGDPRRPAVKKARTSCNPPYSFDADGVKHFKPGCL